MTNKPLSPSSTQPSRTKTSHTTHLPQPPPSASHLASRATTPHAPAIPPPSPPQPGPHPTNAASDSQPSKQAPPRDQALELGAGSLARRGRGAGASGSGNIFVGLKTGVGEEDEGAVVGVSKCCIRSLCPPPPPPSPSPKSLKKSKPAHARARPPAETGLPSRKSTMRISRLRFRMASSPGLVSEEAFGGGGGRGRGG